MLKNLDSIGCSDLRVDHSKKCSMAHMKILYFVTEDWYFWSHRLALAQEAKRRGYEVLVATRIDQYGDRIRDQGFRVVPLNIQRRSTNFWSELSAVLEITNIYRREKPDIVHHVAMKPVLYGSIAARIARVRHVVNALAGLGYVFTSRQLKARCLRPIIRIFFRFLLNHRGSRLILQNKDDCALFINASLVSEDRICLIRGSGVDVNIFSPSSEQGGIPVVVLVSRMLWDKGVREFVAAAELLKKRQMNARFVLVGDRDSHNPSSVPEKMLQDWSRVGIVEWWGKKENISEMFSQVTIACLPSYREGLPKVLLEAAACGLPIVTTDVPGCREIVRHEDNGLLVPVRSTIELADALECLIKDPGLRRRMGSRGREIVVKEFAVEKVVAETMALYEELLQQ